MWIEPVAAHVTSEAGPRPRGSDPDLGDRRPTRRPATVTHASSGRGLDVLQADAAAAVAGDDRLVLIVGPAGAGKTTMLRAAVTDFHDVQHRPVFGVAPTAKAARVFERETGMLADTVAKLLHEWARPDGPDP